MMSAAATKRPNRFSNGDSVLCDFDPVTGRIHQWEARPGIAKLRLDSRELVVERKHKCLLRTSREGEKVTEFQAGQLLCKTHKFALVGSESNPRDGWIYVNTWYVTYSTAYQGRHIGGRRSINIYCIVIDGKVVFRPHSYNEVTVAAGETAGALNENMRCIA